ncbi:hypothetical protein [Methylomagnum sp.]
MDNDRAYKLLFSHREMVKDLLRSGRVPNANFSPIHDLQEAETMLAERVKQWTEEWKQEGLEKGRRDTERSIARALLDIITDDALLSQRVGVPVEEIAAMRREAAGKG